MRGAPDIGRAELAQDARAIRRLARALVRDPHMAEDIGQDASVTVTANHWLLDSVVGALLLAVAYGVARAIDQLRFRQVGWFRTRDAGLASD